MKKNDAGAGGAVLPASPSPGLYVHVPFCATKCPYCGFFSVVAPREARARWLAALRREAAARGGAGRRDDGPEPFDTFYIGGGTPSTLPPDEIERLLGDLRDAFAIAPGAEITIEANPDDVAAPLLAAWRGLGVNRLSLGVQSFDDVELRFLGRRHDADASRRAIALARDAGFSNIGIDLIYGLPGRSPEAWRAVLSEAVAWEPEHLSCYQLSIDPGTGFGKQREAGALAELDEETGRRLFLETSRRLRAAGYLHYEVSNFARDRSLVSRHNAKYWRHVPYVGLGPAAHSFRSGVRSWNARSVEEYCAALEAGRAAEAGSETLSPAELALERLFLGFRTIDGVSMETLRAFPGWEPILEDLVRRSLLAVSGDRAAPTVEGLCVADRLPLLFAG